MATITTINATDLLSASRAVINTNFSNLNSAKVDGATALTTAGRLVEVASSGVATQTSFASSVVVLTSGSYADPAWVTSLATTKLTGTLQATQFPALTGDVTTSAGAVATTLANTAVTPASYGSATQVATFTVDSKGRLTAAASTSIAIAASQVTSGTLDNARTTAASTNTVSAIVARDASGNFAAGTITATFSGNLTGNVTGNASGTAATITGSLALANTPLTTRGDLLVATTATPTLGRLAKGTQYQVLLGGATDPTWGAVDLSQASAITGTLPLGNGGTGATTLAGAGIVAGAASITTANALLIGASAGVLGQSDATFDSGIFSRAGTLGLSATGSNVLTFSTNGSERGRITDSGVLAAAGSIIGVNTSDGADNSYLYLSSTSGAAVTRGSYILLAGNEHAGLGTMQLLAGTGDGSANSGQIQFYTGGGPTQYMTLTNAGRLLIGTTTDDGSSKLQVAGNLAVQTSAGLFKVINAGGASVNISSSASMQYNVATGSGHEFLINSVGKLYVVSSGNTLVGGSSDGNYRLDVQSSGSVGTARFYDQTATTGVTSVVVRAGAGQGSMALQTWQNNAGTALSYVSSTGAIYAPLLYSQAAAGNAEFRADGGTGTSYYLSGLKLMHGNVSRWFLVKEDSAAGNLAIYRYDDAGSNLGTPLSITRANGYISLAESSSRIGFFGVTPAARASALTAADATAINTGDAGSDTAISNMRTRIGELETKLQAYGLLN